MTSEIEELLVWDHENEGKAIAGLSDICSDIIPFCNSMAQFLLSSAQIYAKNSNYEQEVRTASKWMESIGLKGHEGFKYARKAILIGDMPDEDSEFVKTSLSHAMSTTARVFLALRLKKDFLNGLTDLLRARVISSNGYMRIQSENAAIIVLLSEDNRVGEDWLSSADEAAGRKFYRKYQSQISSILKNLELTPFYQNGSNIAYHVRASASALGIITGKEDQLGSHVVLRHQDVNSVEFLFVYFTEYLRMHVKLVEKIQEIYPEITNSESIGLNGAGLEVRFNKIIKIRTELLKSFGDNPIEYLINN